MSRLEPSMGYDSLVNISDYLLMERLGDDVLLGNWFAFLKPEWLAHSGFDKLLASTLTGEQPLASRAAIFFRGQEVILPGATIAAKEMPVARLLSLTSDKALYRAQSDTVRLLLASPLQPNEKLKLQLRLNGNAYAEYSVLLDMHGLAFWSMQGLPEGAYEASLQDGDICRFEVAEYRLALLNAELIEQQITRDGEMLQYTLGITALGRPYTGTVDVELQDRGIPVGSRAKRQCDENGRCHGSFRWAGEGPHTLNIYAGERTATVALKGSEQERRETLTVSDLGEIYEISMLPLPGSEECRSIHIARGGRNNEPFLARSIMGREIEITPRIAVEMLRVVVVKPGQGEGKYAETLYEQLSPEQSVKVPVPAPYGLVLLGAFVEGKAWEGWCAVLRPSDLQVDCQVPKEARPGDRVTIQLKTNAAGRNIPVQLIVKDQRLIASSDPQVELAACIKKNLTSWDKEAYTGSISRKLSDAGAGPVTLTSYYAGSAFPLPPPVMPMMSAPPMPSPGGLAPRVRSGGIHLPRIDKSKPLAVSAGVVPDQSGGETSVATAILTKVRMQFPEVIYNSLLNVDGEMSVEVKLGDSMTSYTVEAFALDAEALDWQRVEASIETMQPVYGELTVSPFVFPGDPIMGRLDVGAASSAALVEVRHDDELLPLFYENGQSVAPGQPVPSGSVLRFPLKPGMITAIVQDANSDEADVSERYVSEPGKLRHITRRLRLLMPGDEVSLSETAILEIKPMPGLERPFQFLVEGAAAYPFGCVEQTSCKLLAMFAGYVTNIDIPEQAREYEAVIPTWYKRLKSMYLPKSGFCMYPPEEGGSRKPDTYYAPKAIKHLLKLPDGASVGVAQPALREILDDIAAMVKDAASYYKIERTPRKVKGSEDAYQVLRYSNSSAAKSEALAFIRSHLVTRDGQTLVEVTNEQNLWGSSVAGREETAYGAAALLLGGESADLTSALAATNYLTGQLNEAGRLYSTVDTEACLSLLMALRDAGVVTTPASGRVALNNQEMTLADALNFAQTITHIRALEGIIAVQITSQIVEDWSAFKSELPVEVHLEQKGRVRHRYAVGDALELVIRVPRYEPGLIAHVCLPDALSRVVGGGQVKRFTLDFCEKNELRVPLAVVGSGLPSTDESTSNLLWRWLGLTSKKEEERHIQHWAVIVRNMYKEEQIGNPGLLEIRVE